MTREQKIVRFGVGLFVLMSLGLLLHGRIGQPADYHQFAEIRDLFGIPNGGNVVSNLAFIWAGWFGIYLHGKLRGKPELPDGNGAFIMLIVGSMFTALGSAYYHAFPSNDSLVWDRIPMTICFSAIFAEYVAIHVNASWEKWILPPMLILGILSVIYWKWTGENGADDLRPYLMVQFFPLLLIPLTVLLFPSEGNQSSAWTKAIVWYAIAKVFEFADQLIYVATADTVSGHTLKHIASGIAIAYALRGMYERRNI